MKLKKIASLALAGVMAVSMLAGCANGTGSSSTTTDDDATVATVTVDDAMNAVQKNVEFKTSTTLDTWLAAAVKKATYSAVEKATVGGSYVAKTADVGAQLADMVTKDYTLQNSWTAFNPTKGGEKTTNLYLYMVDDVTGMESAVNTVAKAVAGNANNYPTRVIGKISGTTGSANVSSYKATYTGEVSCVKVSKTNDDGKTAGAYYVLFAVTQTVADTADNMTGVSGSLT